MRIKENKLKGVLVLESEKFSDDRGFFIESFNQRGFNECVGEEVIFVQDNHSKSTRRVLRGLHYQLNYPQGKLVRCISGEVFDVVVDLRKNSSTFGQWSGTRLNSSEIQLWVPAGFAHGFYTLSEEAEICYKITDYYHPEDQHSLLWNDPSLDIQWGNSEEPILSAKDKLGKLFDECLKYENTI